MKESSRHRLKRTTVRVWVIAVLVVPRPVLARQAAPPFDVPVDTAWTQGPVAVRMELAPERRLMWEVTIPAELPAVWQAWTDPAEIRLWAAPAAEVDLRVGGAWEAHFFPDRPPGERGSDANTIIDIQPDRLLVLSAGAPPEFPTVRREKTVFRVALEPRGKGILLRAEQTGWKSGEEWDRAFITLAYANAVWLGWLHQRFTEGPIDWTEMGFGGSGAKPDPDTATVAYAWPNHGSDVWPRRRPDGRTATADARKTRTARPGRGRSKAKCRTVGRMGCGHRGAGQRSRSP